ncbi:MAG: thioether cross-link-forming SCIFF peptide maturase [Limnochordia bacterium]|nr:thioether cross-link-forming SCIFF peptide maturase [Limnochordia bacterium]MDD2629358.1 thioether cross-link-forming SCIFF peptide maturase [Limnochordia bacterium]MDD4518060.1 thioether cross-link-forming SCIFF peptide maturase [Limnochordia bacterium]
MQNIHLFQLGTGAMNRKFAVDGTSGAIHLLDDEAYGLAQRWVKTGGELPDSEAGKELRVLCDQGLLGASFETVDKGLRAQLETSAPVGIKALCLNIAHDCNLACRYCFANQGHLTKGNTMMDLETSRGAVDFLLANCQDRNPVEIDFFGGEPLLCWNVLVQTVLYGEKRAKELGKELLFTITTNGWDLDPEKIEFLAAHGIAAVLSLDGRKEVNDRMRVSGKGSVYERVVPFFQQLAKALGDERYYLRGTYTVHNLDFLEDVKHLLDLGFTNISLEPVVLDKEHPDAITMSHLGRVQSEYNRLTDHYIQHSLQGKGYRFFHFELDLQGGSCLAKRVSGCSAGCEYLAVDPNGDIYPCHQFVGKDDFAMGNIKDGVTKPDIGEAFAAHNILTKPICQQCWARFYCGGGCHANAWNYNKSISIPHELSCHLQRIRLEHAIYVQTVLAEKGITSFGDRFR